MSVRYIYNTSGAYVAFVAQGHLFAPDGEWIGFLANGNEVYNTTGVYLGFILDDDRVIRNTVEPRRMQLMRPVAPVRPLRPLTPLRRLRMPRLPHPYIDVFERGNADIATKMPGLDLQKYDGLIGAKIVAMDRTYLGTVSRDKYDPESIANEYGQFGSPYAATSIFNQYGQYGGKYSLLSPFNAYSTTPPRLFLNGDFVGQLSANQFLENRIDVQEFVVWLKANGG